MKSRSKWLRFGIIALVLVTVVALVAAMRRNNKVNGHHRGPGHYRFDRSGKHRDHCSTDTGTTVGPSATTTASTRNSSLNCRNPPSRPVSSSR